MRVVRRRPIRAGPEEMCQPRRRRADVGVAVVAVEAPGLEHAVRVAVLAGTADVVHQLVPPVLFERLPDARAELVQHLIPRHLLPRAGAARAHALQRIQDPIGILELVGRDDALGARPAAAAGMNRVAFDLADLEGLLVDVRDDPARGLAVEADARNDPVAPSILLRPDRRLVVDVVVPIGRIRMCLEVSHGDGSWLVGQWGNEAMGQLLETRLMGQ